MEFCFKKEQVVLLQDFVCTFAQLFVHTFSQLTITPDLLWKGLQVHIPSLIFVISMMLMNVFNNPYFLVNITVISVHFYFIFCFEFCYPIVDIIVNHLYVILLRSRKTNTKCNKNEKNHIDIIFAQKVASVARNIGFLDFSGPQTFDPGPHVLIMFMTFLEI